MFPSLSIFIFTLLCDPEDGGEIFILNAGFCPNYTELRQNLKSNTINEVSNISCDMKTIWK
jgi:hypothetical protein